jgi:ferrous iron transport protein B
MGGCTDCGQGGDGDTPIAGELTVALAGNPNTGKSSIFNLLTGARQHVGNWPGKTVSRSHGSFTHEHCTVEVVDLPGTYSLNASSPEEVIARDYLVSREPDAVVIVVDAANLERNLYLTVQVLEIGVPTILVLNMTDVAASRGIEVDDAELSVRLGIPVVRMVARSGSGLEDLKDAVVGVAAWEGTP